MLVEQHDDDGIHEVLVDGPSTDWQKVRVYEVIQNASDEPIWDVVVRALIFTDSIKEGNELGVEECEDEVLCISPHETHKSEITIRTLPYNRFPLKVSFRDNAGREWHRDDRGRLHEGRVFEASWKWIDEVAQEKAVQDRTYKRRRSLATRMFRRQAHSEQ